MLVKTSEVLHEFVIVEESSIVNGVWAVMVCGYKKIILQQQFQGTVTDAKTWFFVSCQKALMHTRIVSASHHRSQGNQSAARRKVAIRKGRRARHFAVKLYFQKLFPRDKRSALCCACVGAKRLEKEVKSGLSSWARCNCSAITRPIDWIKLQSAKNWFCPARACCVLTATAKCRPSAPADAHYRALKALRRSLLAKYDQM